MSARVRPVVADLIGTEPREFIVNPDADGCAALATRMGLPAIDSLTCRFSLWRSKAGVLRAKGMLEATIVQDDVVTMEPFVSSLRESFALRFVPEEKLKDMLDPDDPEDEIGYTGTVLDLEEAMAQQLALALDPYPRQPEPE